jgi:hypothetical protein
MRLRFWTPLVKPAKANFRLCLLAGRLHNGKAKLPGGSWSANLARRQTTKTKPASNAALDSPVSFSRGWAGGPPGRHTAMTCFFYLEGTLKRGRQQAKRVVRCVRASRPHNVQYLFFSDCPCLRAVFRRFFKGHSPVESYSPELRTTSGRRT